MEESLGMETEPAGERKSRPRRAFSRRLAAFVRVSSFCAAIMTLLAFAGCWFWVFELLTHFRVQFVCLATALVLPTDRSAKVSLATSSPNVSSPACTRGSHSP